jgi:cell division septal protein FtsQ
MQIRKGNRTTQLTTAIFCELFIIFVLIFIFLNSSIFNISTILLETDPATIRDLSAFRRSINWWFMSEKQYKIEIITNNPTVKSVKLRKIFPNTLIVQIQMKMPVAYVKTEETIDYLDESGILIKNYQNYQNLNLPQVECSINQIQNNESNQVIHVGLFVIKQWNNLTNEAKIINMLCQNDNIELLFPQFKVIINSDNKPEQVVASLQVLWKQFRIDSIYPKTVDLRFEKPVLLKEDWNNSASNSVNL